MPTVGKLTDYRGCLQAYYSKSSNIHSSPFSAILQYQKSPEVLHVSANQCYSETILVSSTITNTWQFQQRACGRGTWSAQTSSATV